MRTVCTPKVNPFGITAEAGGAGSQFDPCASMQCGEGTCVLKSGFPTCECADGAAATITGEASTTCVLAASDLPTFGPGGGAEARPVVDVGFRARPGNTLYASLSGPMLSALGFLLLLSFRRRTLRARKWNR